MDTDRILENRYDELISDIPKIVNEIEISEINHVKWNPFKVKESINSFSKELIEKLQNRIEASQKRWQSEKFEPFLEEQLKEMADKYQAALAQIFVDIEKIKLREFASIAERMGFEANTLGEFYEEWTKYEATYKLGKEVEYGSVACFDLDDYILTAVSEDPCEEFDLFFQEDTEESCEEE